jgi:diacylglycerol kinase (ATP)
MKNRPFRERLNFALNGIAAAWQREISFRTQTAFATLVAIFLILLRPSLIWWAVIGLTVFFVLTIELLNSAFEALIDHLHPDQHPEVRVIKDMAAGAVLLASVCALIMGVLFLIATLFH